MGFSLLRWRKSGRDWSRGDPPPRGSVEYCGVPEVFQPPSRTTTSGSVKPTAASPPPASPAKPAPRATPVKSPEISRGPSVLWLLGAAGVTYLGARLLERRRTDLDDGEVGGDVIVLGPDDHLMVEGDEESEEVYDPEDEEDNHA